MSGRYGRQATGRVRTLSVGTSHGRRFGGFLDRNGQHDRRRCCRGGNGHIPIPAVRVMSRCRPFASLCLRRKGTARITLTIISGFSAPCQEQCCDNHHSEDNTNNLGCLHKNLLLNMYLILMQCIIQPIRPSVKHYKLYSCLTLPVHLPLTSLPKHPQNSLTLP